MVAWYAISIMENRYSSGNIIVLVILIIAVGILGYFMGVKGIFQKASILDTVSSPTPTTLFSPSITPFYTITPIPLPSIFIPTPTQTTLPLISGIFGLVTLDGGSVSSVEIRISDLGGRLIRAVVTDVNGRFRTELSSGEYILGPFREPRSGATVGPTRVIVRSGYFSEVNATFKSQ